MQCLGPFVAQYFKWLSADPNTIFQFFVFQDRIFVVKVGSAFNQLPQVFSHGLIKGPLGLKDFASENPLTIEEARDLVRETAEPETLSLESKVKSREIKISEIESIENKKTGVFSRGLHVKLGSGDKLFYRFLEPEQMQVADFLISEILGSRFKSK